MKCFIFILAISAVGNLSAAIGGPNAVAKPAKELTAKERERLIQRILEGKSPDEVDPPAEDPAEKPAQNPARTPQP